ncbi:hypothetical protein M8C21_018366 [Ambrosia artemisiifolia]|uniref:non-specific serine/threonine protein kinase n=1 Tax=Ambrosia artemisiifolia TaxID=4212 RepID=A0AAD5BKP5_AMBAR|nr:hypothetical protein M8C21_018366 [Ambrosia artemisiifolia]
MHEEDLRYMENSSTSSSMDKRSIHEEDHGEWKDSPLSSSSLYKQCRVFSLAEIKLATNDFDDALVIGKGGFGKVYKGRAISDTKKDGCDSGGVATASVQVVQPSEDISTQNLKNFTYSELDTATSNFQHDRLIGEGAFGRVFKGWLDKVTYTPQKACDGLPVAIKKLYPESMQGLEEWQAEVNFLGKFSHPNLVKLLGYCQENKKLLLVYEYMQKESLDKHLFRKLGKALPWYTRIKIAIGAAQGLAFLHNIENNVICRDVKTSNILLDEEFNAKLSDFGLAKLGPTDGETHLSTCIMGTYGYAAPEYVVTGCLYVKSDVYGFGVVMLEIITGLQVVDPNRHAMKRNLVDWARPFLRNKKRIHSIMDPRLEHDYPTNAAHKVAELILTCLEPFPDDRPSMEEIVLGLQDINAIKMKPRKSKANTTHEELSVSLDNKLVYQRSRSLVQQYSGIIPYPER